MKKDIQKIKKILTISIILFLVALFFIATKSYADSSLPKLEAPDLKVSIPGMNKLQDVDCQPNACSIPWLADYIIGIQKYAISLLGIIATVVVMFGGVVWLMSGGDSQKISEAKKFIISGITGLVLILSSYVLLYIINPDLTVMKDINVKRIEKIDLAELEFDGHEPMFDPNNAKPITDTTYDETFKNFAACIGVDWRVLKGIAYKESGLNASVVNKYGFTGLFQTKDKYCAESVAKIGLSSSFCSAGVKDPAVNTAVATGMMKYNLSTINSNCSSIGDSSKIFMIYYGHSSGSGALAKAIKNHGCNVDNWPEDIFKGAKKDYVKQTTETVLAQGVTSLTNTSENKTCPKG